MLPVQCKMARTALGWGNRDLAREAGVASTTLMRFEGTGKARPASIEKLQSTLEAAGVEFIPANGGGPGVRLK